MGTPLKFLLIFVAITIASVCAFSQATWQNFSILPNASFPYNTNTLTGLGWVSVKSPPFNATGDGVTDDTAAIQAAVNSITNLGGTVYFPAGIYKLNSGFQSQPGSYPVVNSAILLPIWAWTNSPLITIRFLGEFPPSPLYGTASSSEPVSRSGAILYCTNTAANPTDAVIGTGALSNQLFSCIHLWVENLTIRGPVNPSYTAINAQYCGLATIQNVAVDTGVYPPVTEPTISSVGIALPEQLNAAWTRVDNAVVSNFKTAFKIGEHSVLNNIIAQQCSTGFVMMPSYHSVWVGRSLAQQCPTGIKVTGNSYVTWCNYATEHTQITTNSWMKIINDLDDPLAQLKGTLSYLIITNSGPTSQWKSAPVLAIGLTDLLTGYTTFSTNVMIGFPYAVASSNPTGLSLGGKYSITNASPSNAKLKIFEDGNPDDIEGFSATGNRFEVFVPTWSKMVWITAGQDMAVINADGSLQTGADTNRWIFKGLTVDTGVTNAHWRINGTNFFSPMTPE